MQNGKKCIKCGKPKAESAFYKSSSTNHADGRIPICRKCIIEAAYDAQNDSIDTDNFQRILRQIDKPLIESILDSAIKQHESGVQSGRILAKTGIDRVSAIVGLYFKNLNSLNQYKKMTWEDGAISDMNYNKESREIIVFDNAKIPFGNAYTPKQICFLQALFDLWKDDYNVKNEQERNALIQYVENRLSLEYSIIFNDIGEFIDCNNDVVESVVKYKSMRESEDKDFASEYKSECFIDE